MPRNAQFKRQTLARDNSQRQCLARLGFDTRYAPLDTIAAVRGRVVAGRAPLFAVPLRRFAARKFGKVRNPHRDADIRRSQIARVLQQNFVGRFFADGDRPRAARLDANLRRLTSDEQRRIRAADRQSADRPWFGSAGGTRSPVSRLATRSTGPFIVKALRDEVPPQPSAMAAAGAPLLRTRQAAVVVKRAASARAVACGKRIHDLRRLGRIGCIVRVETRREITRLFARVHCFDLRLRDARSRVNRC